MNSTYNTDKNKYNNTNRMKQNDDSVNTLIIHDNNQVVTKEQLIENVRRWVLLDSQIKLINEKTKKIRELKHTVADSICKYMSAHKLANNKISISEGELCMYEKKEYSPLTYGYVEKCLAELISDKSQVDFIIQYLKDHREITSSPDIRRTYHKKITMV